MQGKLARAVVEALFLVIVYALAEHFWRHQPLLGDITGLVLVGVSYLILSVVAIVLGWAWRR